MLSALLAIALLTPGLGPVSGAIPNPADGKFYGCMVRATGVVKLINYPKVSTCPKGQRLIDWGRTGPQGPAGPQGAQGLQGGQGDMGSQGNQGLQGVQGMPGITKITLTHETAVQVVPDMSFSDMSVTCPAGKVVGGGFRVDGGIVDVFRSYPVTATRWSVSVQNVTGFSSTITVYAICMTTEPSTVIAKVGKGAKKRR
jgi:hypothetical protein